MSLGGLWWFMALSNAMTALWPRLVEPAVSSQKRWMPSGLHDTCSSWRWEKICTIKSIIPPCRICLSAFPYLAQNPACCKTKVSFSGSFSGGGCADRRFCQHSCPFPLHLGAADVFSALLLQRANCLSY